MTLNLLRDPWLPLRTRQGVKLAPPWEVSNPDVHAVASPRADFQTNLVLFLVGLYQTLLTPKNSDAWFEWWQHPPPPGLLRQEMAKHESHFNVDSGDRRFLQDRAAGDRKDASPAIELLMETPTGQTLDHNKDLFTKRKATGALCLPCSASALFTLQANAPEGGRGQNVSLRGGGPLTTLLESDSLWGTVWANVLCQSDVDRLPGTGPAAPERVYPWEMTRIQGGKEGRPTVPEDGHPLMALWGMPRRIHLDEPRSEGTCSVCGHDGIPVVESFRSAPNGFQYHGWRHPHSPYRDEDGSKRALRTSGRGMTYRDWLGFVLVDQDRNVEPSDGVRVFWRDRLAELPQETFRVLAFGYQTNKNSVLSWQESRMPLQRIPSEGLPAFDEATRLLVTGAQAMARILESSVKQALFRRPGDAKGDLGFISLAYWSRTHPAFYEHQKRISERGIEALNETMTSWHEALFRAGKALFSSYVLSSPFGQTDPQRIATAWTWMGRNFRSQKTRASFGLPKTEQKDRRLESEVPA